MARKTQARATEREKLGKKPTNICGEQPVKKGVGCEGQSVKPGRLTEASGLLGDAAQGYRAEPGSTELQDFLASFFLGTCNHGRGEGGAGG